MALAITKDNFEEISASQLPVVIDFWAEWCGPCRMISPIIDELAGEYEGRAVIGECDVDNNDDIVASSWSATFRRSCSSRADRSWTNRWVPARKPTW